MNDLNDSIFKQLAETYRQINELYHGNVSDCMKQCKEVHPHLSNEECKKQYCEESMTTQGRIHESHTHEELMKLSDEKLAELKDEYTKKIADSKGEEKEKHEKELANIEKIMASRKDDKKEEKKEKIEELNTEDMKSYLEKSKMSSVKKKPGESGKEIIENMRALTKKVAHKKRLAEESNEDHIAHHLSNAQTHWNHMEKGYDSDAVPHMKKAKALLQKATPEEQKRYKFIMDRLDKPHREAIEEDISQAKLADKVVTNAEKIKKLQKQAAPAHNVKKGK
jgi:hypothetical protein